MKKRRFDELTPEEVLKLLRCLGLTADVLRSSDFRKKVQKQGVARFTQNFLGGLVKRGNMSEVTDSVIDEMLDLPLRDILGRIGTETSDITP